MSNCSLIVDQNLVDQRSAFSYSSQQTSYPATNALDANKRARTWRTQGYWRIISGENTLVIRDASGGSDLTATVTAAVYTSDTAFFAAMKTALEAVSDSTFTISRDATTNAIKITAVLAGAATHFEIRGAAAGSADFAPILGFALTNTSGALFYVAPVLKLHTEEYLIIDFGFAVSPTVLLGFGDKSRALRISSTATVSIQGNATDSVLAWDTPQVDVSVTVADQGIGHVNRYGIGGTASAAGTACRYWKLKIIDTANPYGHIELGAFILGTHMVFARGNVVYPLNVRNLDLSEKGYTEGGQAIASARAQTKIAQLNFEGLTKADKQLVDELFETFGTHSVFAICLDPDGAFTTDLMKWSKLVRVEDGQEPQESLGSPGNWEAQWTVREDL